MRITASMSLVAAVVVYAASGTSVNILPHQVTAYVSALHLSNAQAGIAAMSETAALALMTLLAVTVPSRYERMIAVVAPVLAATAQLGSIVMPNIVTLCVLRAVVGAGCGAAGCVAARSLGTSASPAQAFGISNGVSALISGLFLAGVPYFPSISPGIRVFVPLGVLAALLGVAGAYTPSRHPAEPVAAPAGAAGSRATLTPALTLLFATTLLYVPLGGIWTFSVQQGTQLGLSERQVGVMLTWMIPAGLIGGTVAAWIQRCVGLFTALCLAGGAAVLTCLLIATAHTPLLFGLSFAWYAATYMFALSVLQAAGVIADSSGRLSAVMFGMTLVGCALGSFLVGLLLDRGAAATIGGGGMLVCVIAGVLALWATRASRQQQQVP